MPGWFPCCCRPGPGSTVPIGSSVLPPFGSSQGQLPGCGMCRGGLISRFYQVEIEGLGVGEKPECEDACNDFNGAYVIEITDTSPTNCSGQLLVDGACQDSLGGVCYRRLLLSFFVTDASLPVRIRFTLGPRSGDTGAGECSAVASIIWQADVTPGGQVLDCLTLDRVALPFVNQTGSLHYCDGSNATVYVTAL